MLGAKTQTITSYRQRRDDAAAKLRKMSWMTYGLERTFFWLEKLSPGSTAPEIHGSDNYLAYWFAGAVALSASSWYWYAPLPLLLKLAIWIGAGLRTLDIIQMVGNFGLFEHLGSAAEDGKLVVIHATRSLVMLIWNFIELIIWFGLLYLTTHFAQDPSRTFWSTFYFSAITQLTIGYGDFSPIGIGKALSVAQGLIGWLMTVVLLARFITGLPGIQSRTKSQAVVNVER